MTTTTKPEAIAPVVTRQQRVEALILCGWSERGAALLAFEQGFSSDLTHDQLAIATRALNAITTAEARGAERERADVIQKLRERAVGLRSVTTLRTAYLSAACWIENGMPMREAGERIAKEGT